MEIGKRISEFIKNCYGKQTIFAELINIDKATLNKYILDKHFPGGEVLVKFYQAGMSIEWLFDANGSMFANNEVGQSLRTNYKNKMGENSISPITRLKEWIIGHFESIDAFAVTIDENYIELHDLLSGNYLADIDLLTKISEAGCNFHWLTTGEGSKYSDNVNGRKLESKKIDPAIQFDFQNSKDETEPSTLQNNNDGKQNIKPPKNKYFNR
jgi:hypothetical protein